MNLGKKLLNKYHVWKLRKALVVCKDRAKFPAEVHNVARSFEASLSMTENLEGTTELSVRLTRIELEIFVKYITQLHATKLSVIQEIKWAITAVMMKGRLTDDDMRKLIAAQAMASQSIGQSPGQRPRPPQPKRRSKRKIH